MKTLSAALLLAWCFVACSSKKNTLPDNLFTGVWIGTDTAFAYNEEWQAGNNMLKGKSYVLNGKDTTIEETVELKTVDGALTYIPVAYGQNNEQPVPFTLISSTDTSFVFENKAHDFPQRIFYRFVGKDSLVAGIEGISKGVRKERVFHFRKKM